MYLKGVRYEIGRAHAQATAGPVLDLVALGALDPARIVTATAPFSGAVESMSESTTRLVLSTTSAPQAVRRPATPPAGRGARAGRRRRRAHRLDTHRRSPRAGHVHQRRSHGERGAHVRRRARTRRLRLRRFATSADGRAWTRQRWSTPIADHRSFDGRRVGAFGRAHRHPADEPSFDDLESRADRIGHLEASPARSARREIL